MKKLTHFFEIIPVVFFEEDAKKDIFDLNFILIKNHNNNTFWKIEINKQNK